MNGIQLDEATMICQHCLTIHLSSCIRNDGECIEKYSKRYAMHFCVWFHDLWPWLIVCSAQCVSKYGIRILCKCEQRIYDVFNKKMVDEYGEKKTVPKEFRRVRKGEWNFVPCSNIVANVRVKFEGMWYCNHDICSIRAVSGVCYLYTYIYRFCWLSLCIIVVIIIIIVAAQQLNNQIMCVFVSLN